MSVMTPDKYGGPKSPTKTTQMEVRISNADAELAWDSEDNQVLGNANPGSFKSNPSMNKTEARYGVTSVAHEIHMSERDSGFSIALNEATAKARALANGTDLPPVFNIATTGFTSSTVAASPTLANQVNLQTTTGLTTDDLLLFTHFASDSLKTFQEERYIKRVSGATVYLRHPLSRVPDAASTVQRLTGWKVREGGSNYAHYTANLKTTAVDKSLHVLHYKDVVVETSTAGQGSNSELMQTELNFKAMAYPETINGADEPIFSEENFVPRNVAVTL